MSLLLPPPTYPIWLERLKVAIKCDDVALVSLYLDSAPNTEIKSGDKGDMLRLTIEELSERVFRYLLTFESWISVLLSDSSYIRKCSGGTLEMLERILHEFHSRGIDISTELVSTAHACLDCHLDPKKEAVVLLLIRNGLDPSALRIGSFGGNKALFFFAATIGCENLDFRPRLPAGRVVEMTQEYEHFVRIGKRIACKKDVEKPLTVAERIDAKRMFLQRSCKNVADICLAFHLLPALQTLMIIEQSSELYHLLDVSVLYSKIVAAKNKAAIITNV